MRREPTQCFETLANEYAPNRYSERDLDRLYNFSFVIITNDTA